LTVEASNRQSALISGDLHFPISKNSQ
jgi:hypothetical protein